MVNEDQFRKACGAFPTGVAIVTFAIDDTDVHGITISSFTSVSLRPPLILFCIHQQSRILPVLRCSQHFCSKKAVGADATAMKRRIFCSK